MQWLMPELGGCGAHVEDLAWRVVGEGRKDFARFDKRKVGVTRTIRAISCFHFLRLAF